MQSSVSNLHLSQLSPTSVDPDATVDASRTRPSKFHAGRRGTRQPSDATLATRIREEFQTKALTFEMLFNLTQTEFQEQLEGHLLNFIVAMNRLEDISHEQGARRGLGLGQGM